MTVSRGKERRSGIAIALMGLDGTGKSTQTERLQSTCTRHGENWVRIHHSSTKLPGIAHLKRRFHSRAITLLKREGAHVDLVEARTRSLRGRILSWPLIMWLLLGSFMKSLWYQWHLTHANVLFDRCFLDDVVKVRWRFDAVSFLAAFLMRIAPKPELVILLEGDLPVTYARKKDMNCTYEEYVEKGRILNLTLGQAEEMGWTIRRVTIHGLTVDQVATKVLATVRDATTSAV